MSHARDDFFSNVVENGVQGLWKVGCSLWEASREVARLHLGEDWVGFDILVVISNEIYHSMGMFAKFFRV